MVFEAANFINRKGALSSQFWTSRPRSGGSTGSAFGEHGGLQQWTERDRTTWLATKPRGVWPAQASVANLIFLKNPPNYSTRQHHPGE